MSSLLIVSLVLSYVIMALCLVPTAALCWCLHWERQQRAAEELHKT